MQLTAKLVQVLPVETGEGRNGTWKKQNVIVETDGPYPKKVCVSIWGDKISPSELVEGNNLTIEFDVESREFNGRWYTDVKAWSVKPAGSAPQPMAPQQPYYPANAPAFNLSAPPAQDAPAPTPDNMPF
jgi:hypothetical protein